MKSVVEFLKKVENETRKSDAFQLLAIIEEESGYKPHLSGSIIGYGQYHYKYASGREGDCFVTGYSPRKQNIAIYVMPGFAELQHLLADLGKHKTGKSCLYINKLEDINLEILRKIVKLSVKTMQEKHPCREV